jgi:hypothetical protein
VSDQLEDQTEALAEALIAGDHPAAERALDGLRELAWRRRAEVIRARRHAGPGTRAFVRLKPRLRAADAATEPVAGRRGA